ncbi:hypothetical protein [Nonomuraea pusilla]|uniref:hypothetical protein n=1 Tax=Nonomuraea pusilla TaxID=46177 RepID=UPI0011608904|nr:hypothetical protein [Nonomuraea pusilla]
MTTTLKQSSAPQPTATVTITVVKDPDPVPLTDHLQGWGTVAAVIAALVIALVGWRVEALRRVADKEAGDQEREQDREDADRRLREERATADTRLQQQRDEQRRQERRDFVIRQLQEIGDLYALTIAEEHTPQSRTANQRMELRLRALPETYASLLKLKLNIASAEDREMTRRLMQDWGIADAASIDSRRIFVELMLNLADVLAREDVILPYGADRQRNS